jgi:hypothetical protein
MTNDTWLSLLFIVCVGICYGSLIWQVKQIDNTVKEIIDQLEKRNERNRNDN